MMLIAWLIYHVCLHSCLSLHQNDQFFTEERVTYLTESDAFKVYQGITSVTACIMECSRAKEESCYRSYYDYKRQCMLVTKKSFLELQERRKEMGFEDPGQYQVQENPVIYEPLVKTEYDNDFQLSFQTPMEQRAVPQVELLFPFELHNVSLCFWLKVDGFIANTKYIHVYSVSNRNPDRACNAMFRLYIANKQHFAYMSSTNEMLLYPFNITLGRWMNVCVVRHLAANTNPQRYVQHLYVNGTFSGTIDIPFGINDRFGRLSAYPDMFAYWFILGGSDINENNKCTIRQRIKILSDASVTQLYLFNGTLDHTSITNAFHQKIDKIENDVLMHWRDFKGLVGDEGPVFEIPFVL